MKVITARSAPKIQVSGFQVPDPRQVGVFMYSFLKFSKKMIVVPRIFDQSQVLLTLAPNIWPSPFSYFAKIIFHIYVPRPLKICDKMFVYEITTSNLENFCFVQVWWFVWAVMLLLFSGQACVRCSGLKSYNHFLNKNTSGNWKIMYFLQYAA